MFIAFSLVGLAYLAAWREARAFALACLVLAVLTGVSLLLFHATDVLGLNF
jgi:hypothetical protein